MTSSDETSIAVRWTSRPTNALSPTRRGQVLLLWLVAQAVGLAGTRLINVAVPWFVLVTTRDPALAGVAALAQMAPLVVAKALAGPLIDRVGAVRVAVTADLSSCLAVAAVPLLHLAGVLSWPLLLVIAAIEGMLRGPGDSAKYALCPSLAELTGRPLERVTGLAGTVDRVGSAVGAAFGGLVIAAVGAPRALLLSCVTFLVAALLIGFGLGRLLPSALGAGVRGAGVSPAGIQPGDASPSGDSPAGASTSDSTSAATDGSGESEGSYGQRLRDGFAYWRRDAILVSVTVLVACTNLLDQAYLAVLVPEWALRGGLGAEVVGLVFGAYTAAAVLGSAVATAVADRLPTLATCVVAFLLTGPPRYLALGLQAPRAALIALVCVAGLASGFLNPVIGAVIFGRIPRHLVGRVSSLQTSLCWALIPFGGVVGGLLVNDVGGRAALLLCGAAYVALALVPLAIPGWRALAASPRRRAG